MKGRPNRHFKKSRLRFRPKKTGRISRENGGKPFHAPAPWGGRRSFLLQPETSILAARQIARGRKPSSARQGGQCHSRLAKVRDLSAKGPLKVWCRGGAPRGPTICARPSSASFLRSWGKRGGRGRLQRSYPDPIPTKRGGENERVARPRQKGPENVGGGGPSRKKDINQMMPEHQPPNLLEHPSDTDESGEWGKRPRQPAKMRRSRGYVFWATGPKNHQARKQKKVVGKATAEAKNSDGPYGERRRKEGPPARCGASEREAIDERSENQILGGARIRGTKRRLGPRRPLRCDQVPRIGVPAFKKSGLSPAKGSQ